MTTFSKNASAKDGVPLSKKKKNNNNNNKRRVCGKKILKMNFSNKYVSVQTSTEKKNKYISRVKIREKIKESKRK